MSNTQKNRCLIINPNNSNYYIEVNNNIQKTIHLKGNETDLNVLTLKLFGVPLSEIKL